MSDSRTEKARLWREDRKARGLSCRPTPIERYQAKPTRQNAISANCYLCVGGDADPGWIERIRTCGVEDCTLMDFRPYK